MNPSVHTDDTRFLELLERWLTGEFNRSDERELRALTEADAFRREAWEGFAALPGDRHAEQLTRLRRRLRGRSGGARIPAGMWMAAVAALLLLLAAVYFLPRMQPAEPASQAARSAKLPVAPDSAGAAAPASNPAPAGQNRASGPIAGIAADAAETAPAEREAGEVITRPPARIFEGLPPRTSAPAAPVTVGGPEHQLQNAPIPGVPAGPAANYIPEKATVADAPPPAEAAKEDSRTKKAESAAQPPASAEQAPAPAGGWDNFHRYMRLNARLTEAARNNNISGKVLLQFTIGPDGKPANVLVVQVLGYGCDEEAMRLIRQFDWSPAGAGPLVVEVPFVR